MDKYAGDTILAQACKPLIVVSVFVFRLPSMSDGKTTTSNRSRGAVVTGAGNVDETAVAGASGDASGPLDSADDVVDAAQSAAVWLWDPSCTETMHPFWAVSRMAGFELAHENARAMMNAARENQSAPQKLRYNCGFEDVAAFQSIAGRFGTTALLDQRRVVFHKIVNTHHMIAGQELLIQAPDPPNENVEPPTKKLNVHEEPPTYDKEVVPPPADGTDADSGQSPAKRQTTA